VVNAREFVGEMITNVSNADTLGMVLMYGNVLVENSTLRAR